MSGCRTCGEPTSLSRNSYCSISCQHEFSFRKKYEKFLAGETTLTDPRSAKKAVIRRDGYKCSCCGLSEWCEKPLTLELEHKDGNSSNNQPSNLCLCPNCHSQTPTYKAKNKGNGRHSRRQRYADGKSY